MGLFGNSAPFDADVEKATNENNTTDQWGLIMEICDRVGASSINAKECLKAVMRRLSHNDPHVVIQAVTLLDALVNNCGKTFHLVVASREFETEYRKLINRHQSPVKQKLAHLIKKWAQNDFKADPQLNLIPCMYQKLVADSIDCKDPDEKGGAGGGAGSAKASQVISKDPNVVQSQEEMDDIAKAIELSLKESTSPAKQHTYSTSSASSNSAYLNGTSGGSGGGSSGTESSLYPRAALPAASEARKVRALYDFEAAEDNELIFSAGEIIHVMDDSDPNWWKGYNKRGEGLFPASFVTADLSVEPEHLRVETGKAKKTVQFADELQQPHDEHTNGGGGGGAMAAAKLLEQVPVAEISEEKLNRLMHLLHEANPEDPSEDSMEMLQLELMVNQMGPLIDAELERVDRTHAKLAQLGGGLVEAFNLYHTLMRESDRVLPQYMAAVGGYMPPGQHPGHGPYLHGIPGMHPQQQQQHGYGPQQHQQQPPGMGPMYQHHPMAHHMSPQHHPQQHPHPSAFMPQQQQQQQSQQQQPAFQVPGHMPGPMNNGVGGGPPPPQQQQQQQPQHMMNNNVGPMQPPHMGAFQPPVNAAGGPLPQMVQQPQQMHPGMVSQQQMMGPQQPQQQPQPHAMIGVSVNAGVAPQPQPPGVSGAVQSNHGPAQLTHQTVTNNAVGGPIVTPGPAQQQHPGGVYQMPQNYQQQPQQQHQFPPNSINNSQNNVNNNNTNNPSVNGGGGVASYGPPPQQHPQQQHQFQSLPAHSMANPNTSINNNNNNNNNGPSMVANFGATVGMEGAPASLAGPMMGPAGHVQMPVNVSMYHQHQQQQQHMPQQQQLQR